MFGYLEVYFVQYITNKSDMKAAHKIVNYLINENIFFLKVCKLRQDVWYLGKTNLCQNTHFIYQNPSKYLFQLVWCLNRTNFPIFNMQDFRYWIVLVSWCPHYEDSSQLLIRVLLWEIYLTRKVYLEYACLIPSNHFQRISEDTNMVNAQAAHSTYNRSPDHANRQQLFVKKTNITAVTY